MTTTLQSPLWPCQQFRLFDVRGGACIFGVMEIRPLKERIFEAREYAGKSQTQVAAEVRQLPGGEQFSQQHFSNLETGQQEELTIYIPYIAHVCGVSAIWLAAEVGSMVANRFDADTLAVARDYASLRDEGDKQYIRGWLDAKKPLPPPSSGIDPPEKRQ